MDIAGALQPFGGVARTRDLIGAGATARQLRAAICDGAVLPVVRGVIARSDAPEDFLRAYRHNGRISCVSAAEYLGLWQLNAPQKLHLRCNHGRTPGGYRIHRGPFTHPHPRLPLASPEDVLVDAVHCLPPVEALVMIESAIANGLVFPDFVAERLKGSANGKARRVLDLVERGAQSPIEVVARVLFRRNGIRAEAQVSLPGIGVVDFLLEGFLIVEIDGLQYHLTRRQFVKDRRRDNAAAADGYSVLRFVYDDVVHHPEAMLDMIRTVLSRYSASARSHS